MKKNIEVIKIYKFFNLEFKKLDDAAAYFGVSKQMMSAVFNGHKKPTKKMLEKVGIKVIKTEVFEKNGYL